MRRGLACRTSSSRRPRPRPGRAGALAVTAALTAALAVGTLAACSPAPIVAVRGDRPGSSVDDSAPPGSTDGDAAGEGDDSLPLDRLAAAAAEQATSDDDPTAEDAGTAPTPGHLGLVSQPTGRGYVDTLVENRLPGTPGWQSVRADRRGSIEGFADATSVVAGRRLQLFVSSSAATFRIQVLRLGWYSGVGARQIWISDPVRGGRQVRAHRDPATHMVTAPWKASANIPTARFVAGDYVAKLLGADGASSFVPFAVREQRSTGAVLMLNSTLTWLAYNPWGGANTYTASGASSKAEGYEERSVVTSMDRPYALGSGTGGLFDEELNLVQTAERLGLELNYASDVDLHNRPEVLLGATGVAVLGHSEYWSRQMRAALTAARDSGINVAFLGANDIYRRIRLQPAVTGPHRLMVNYKDGTQDPVTGIDTTADWPHEPHRDPESSLTGVQYRCAHARADMVVTDPDAWLFRGLGLARGQRLRGLIGPEIDRVHLGVSTPRPIQIMAHSPVSCYGYPEYSDLVWYSAPSGAGVFAAGTLDWDTGMSSPDPTTRTIVTAVTQRVLSAMAHPQAGRIVPAVDNAATFYTPSGTPRSTRATAPARAGAVTDVTGD